jgi:hypothetical protein
LENELHWVDDNLNKIRIERDQMQERYTLLAKSLAQTDGDAKKLDLVAKGLNTEHDGIITNLQVSVGCDFDYFDMFGWYCMQTVSLYYVHFAVFFTKLFILSPFPLFPPGGDPRAPVDGGEAGSHPQHALQRQQGRGQPQQGREEAAHKAA